MTEDDPSNDTGSASEGFRDPVWRHNMLALSIPFALGAAILGIICWWLT